MPERRPPVKMMESRDERVTVRFTPTEIDVLRVHAMASGDELSRYISLISTILSGRRRTSVPR